MAGSDENNVGVIRHGNFQVEGFYGGDGKLSIGGIVQNRRALGNINQNIIGRPLNPCAVSKTALPEKIANCQKNDAIPSHRPVTRKFAALLASKEQYVKKRVQIAPAQSGPEDSTISIVEDYMSSSDTHVPMFVQHTEAMLDEIDRMEEEIEMEDVDEEPVFDIDDADANDPLAIVEYIHDLYANYKKVEHSGSVSSNYMGQQYDINERMRGILIDWLIEVHYKFELMEETLYLTVNLIDRFLALQPVERKKLQLVGVTALLLACKYEEVSVPVVDDLILISDKAYTRKEVLDMEKLMLNKLQFKLSVPTPYVFMRRFLKAAQSDKKLELLSYFMIELCLVEYEMLKFAPSMLAAASIFTAQSTVSGLKEWNKTSEWHTSYSQDLLMECSRKMVTFHQKAATGKLTGVHRKYSTLKFGYAARTEPALFLLE